MSVLCARFQFRYPTPRSHRGYIGSHRLSRLGSLIWEPKGFSFQDQWFEDGLLIPAEFARQSQDGRITLVLVETGLLVPSLWAVMESTDLASAVEALRRREGILEKNVEKHVCRWSVGQPSPTLIRGLSGWANAHEVAHVI